MAREVGFSVGTVARRLGIAPSTLRTWNRRYGIGAQELSPGRHRRYTADDITRLEQMQKLILRGAAPADAARAALADTAAPAEAPPAGPGPGPGRTGPGHGAGGQRLALPGASAAARGLARAALAMDDTLMGEIIRAALDRDGVVRTWEDLLVPVLSGIGTRYEHSGQCIEAEHLLSAVILAALAGIGRPGRAASITGPSSSPAPLVSSTASRSTRSRPRWPSAASVPGCSAPTCPTGRWRPLSGAPARPPCSCGRRPPRARMPGRCRICGRAGPVRGCCSAAPGGRMRPCLTVPAWSRRCPER